MKVWKLIVTIKQRNGLIKFEDLKVPYGKFTNDNLDNVVDQGPKR